MFEEGLIVMSLYFRQKLLSMHFLLPSQLKVRFEREVLEGLVHLLEALVGNELLV